LSVVYETGRKVAVPITNEPTQERQALADIQGNLVAGFNKDHVEILLYEIRDPDRARHWLELMAGDVATSDEVARFNELFSLVRSRRHDGREPIKATWTQLLLSAEGLRRVGVGADEIVDVDPVFATGMKAQAEALGDVSESAPEAWSEPYRSRVIHVAVLIASDDGIDLAREVDHVQREAEEHGLVRIGTERGHTLDGMMRGHELFGFKDGISQPAIQNLEEPAAGEPPAVPLGTFVLGWPGGFGPDEVPEWAHNGSLVVLRRLRQDVPAFRSFVEEQSSGLDEPSERLGAQLVGRWASGAPLALSPDADDLALAQDGARNNAFGYSDDPSGFHTPRFAHIRKVHPRDQGPNPPDLDGQHRRLLRRGIPYGVQVAASAGAEEDSHDRGLLFICAQSSIEQQFQFIQQRWSNDPNFPQGPTQAVEGYQPTPGDPADGPDPISGQHHGQGADTLRRDRVAPTPVGPLRQFVRTTGGEYFFCPGLAGLRALARMRPST
jgi:Dyp-type peroxidase family